MIKTKEQYILEIAKKITRSVKDLDNRLKADNYSVSNMVLMAEENEIKLNKIYKIKED